MTLLVDAEQLAE